MTEKARLEQTETGQRPADGGWYILNLAEMCWRGYPGGGAYTSFESGPEPSDRLGIGVHILWADDSPGYYHAEENLEGFLVLSGECAAIRYLPNPVAARYGHSVPRESGSPAEVYADRPPIQDVESCWPPPAHPPEPPG
jgi:hypothetical protein